MPFRYTPNQNRYVGSIADLMGRGNEAEAQALIASANAQAQAAQASGQAWGGAVQGIGNTVSQGITDWNSPAARRQREMDKAAGIARAGAEDRRIAQEEAIINQRDPEPVPTRSMLENVMRNYPDRFGVVDDTSISTGEEFIRAPAATEGVAQSMQNFSEHDFRKPGPAPLRFEGDTIMQPFADRGYEGDIGMRAKLDETGQPVMRGRYTQDNGQYDSDALLRDLIAAGIPLDVANQFAAQGVQANTIIAAGADISKQYRESQLAIQGEVAGMALRAIEIGVSPEEAVRQANPGGDVLPADQVRQFEVMFHRKTPEEQIQILEEIRRRASFLGELTAAPRGTNLYNEQGDLVGQGQSTATAPTLGSKADMFLSWFGPTPTVEQKEAGLREWTRLNELPVLGFNDIDASYLNLADVGVIPRRPGNTNAGATGSNGGTGSGGRATDYLNQYPDPGLGTTGDGLRGDSQAPPAIGVNPPPAVSDAPGGAPTESSTQGLVPQEDSEFQAFPTVESGRRAQRDLWLSDSYQNRTVKEALERWTGGPGGAPDGYMNGILAAANDPTGDKSMRDVSDAELSAMMAVQQTWEGWEPGSRSYRNNNPGNIKHTASSSRARNERPPVPELPTLESFEQPQPSLVRDPISGVVRTVPEGGSGSIRAGRRQATQPRTGLTAPGSAVEPALSGQPLASQEQVVGRIEREFGAPRPVPQQARSASPAQTRSLRSSPPQPRAESRPGEYTRDSPQAYVMRHAGPTPTDAERRKLEAEYQLFQRSAIAAQVDPSAGPSFDPLAHELGIRPNSDGVYNLRTLSPVMTPNLGDTISNAMDFAMYGMTGPEKTDTIQKFARFVQQRQPAHVMKHLVYTTGLEGLGQAERDQIKGRYTTQLALRGIVSILGDMREAGVHTGYLTGNIENLYAMIGKVKNPELASLKTRLQDMVIAYRRAATGVQFGVTEKQDYENMMPGVKFDENLNLARIGGLNTAMNDHMQSFWQQRIGNHNAPTLFPEFYPSEPDARDFLPGEIRILEDGTRWVMGENGEDPLALPFEEKDLNKTAWWSVNMLPDLWDKLTEDGEIDPSQPPPDSFF